MEGVPLEELAADDERTVDEDAVRQQEILDVGRIARRVLQQVGHQPLNSSL